MSLTDLSQRISCWAAEHRQRIVQLAADLIRQPTVNQVTDGTERCCQEALLERFEKMGLETQLYSPEEAPGFRSHPAYFPGKDYRDRPNLAGVWRGRGKGRSLLFSGHVDTAVVAPGWTGSPWEPRIEQGRLYGLGSFDMKGGIAASIMAVQCLKELGIQVDGDVILESVVDEEFGGANGTLAGRLMGYHADAAIIPEPTNLVVCPATRGGALWRLTFTGKTGLSFSGETLRNPLYDAAKFLVFLERYEKERSARSGPAPWYAASGELPVIPTRAVSGDTTALLCDVGPEECQIDVWVECHPGTTEESLRDDIVAGYLRHFGEDAAVPEFRKMIRFLPGSQVSPDLPFLPVLSEQVRRVTAKEPVLQGAPFACDAFMFNLYSPTPAVVFGPSGANAHAADEYVDIDSLCRLTEIYALTILEWCGWKGDEEDT